MLDEIINSCSNASVAEAAVRSIGGNVAEAARSAAEARGLSLGTYASGEVRAFDREATPQGREALLAAIRRTDQPILAGLRFILERAMSEEADLQPRDRARGSFGRPPHVCCAMA